MDDDCNIDEDDEIEDYLRFQRNALRCVAKLFAKETSFDSPINLNIGEMMTLRLPPLLWHNYTDICKKMKLLNSGHTIILSAKWFDERPFLNGGPLNGNYVFSQLHFHWGANDIEGSEHTVDGTQHPIEMHVVHFKSCYLTQEAALREHDGVVILVYFFKLQSHTNPDVQILLDAARQVRKANMSFRMERQNLYFLLKPFQSDYFMYWGSVTTSTALHVITYIICRIPIGISAKQVCVFRKLYNSYDEPNIHNYRDVVACRKNVYHVNPSTMKYATLLPIPAENFIKKKKIY